MKMNVTGTESVTLRMGTGEIDRHLVQFFNLSPELRMVRFHRNEENGEFVFVFDRSLYRDEIES